jgi:hypothetical protein
LTGKEITRMSGVLWIIPVSILLITACMGCGEDNRREQSMDNDSSTDMVVQFTCPDGSTEHETSSGRKVCCPKGASRFCDENSEGYEGGCWQNETDCNTITECGDTWVSCPEGSLPFCDDSGQLTCHVCPEGAMAYETTRGMPVCCTADFPKFCNETAGYQGGCWQDDVNCETIVKCGDEWVACSGNMEVICDEENREFFCSPAT